MPFPRMKPAPSLRLQCGYYSTCCCLPAPCGWTWQTSARTRHIITGKSRIHQQPRKSRVKTLTLNNNTGEAGQSKGISVHVVKNSWVQKTRHLEKSELPKKLMQRVCGVIHSDWAASQGVCTKAVDSVSYGGEPRPEIWLQLTIPALQV